MTFFSRPILEDLQFKQLSDSILTLSGTTRFVNVTGLTLTDGNGIYIPIIATGGTNGKVLTYRDDVISLEDVTGSEGGGIYSGSSPTTCTVGGLLSNSSIVGCSISNILQKILVPALAPSTSLSIITGFSGGSLNARCREFGDDSIGLMCFNVIKNDSNNICEIKLDSYGDIYQEYNVDWASPSGTSLNQYPTIYHGQTTGSTYSYLILPEDINDIVCPSNGVFNTFAEYAVCAKNTESLINSSASCITWMNRRYCFKSATPYIAGNCAGTCTLMCNSVTSQLCNIKATNMSLAFNNEFFYYSYPSAMGTPTITVNNLLNNAWGSSASGTLFSMTFTNKSGYSIPYYVARSDSRITGTYCIVIS